MKSTDPEKQTESIQIKDIDLHKDLSISESHQENLLKNERIHYRSFCNENSSEFPEHKHSKPSKSLETHATDRNTFELLEEDQNDVIGSLIDEDDVINEDVQFSTCHNTTNDNNMITDAQESSSIILTNDDIVVQTETENLYNSNLKELHLEQFTDDENEIIASNNCAALTLTTDSCSSTCDETTADDLEPSLQKIHNLNRGLIVENDPNQIEEKFTDAENYVLENLSGEIIIDDSTGFFTHYLLNVYFLIICSVYSI
jgi:hypothetical protein